MRWAVLTLVLGCLLGLTVLGDEFAGRMDCGFLVSQDSDGDWVLRPYANLALEYSQSGWTFGGLARFGQRYWPAPETSNQSVTVRGLQGMTFVARGALGAYNLISAMDFGVQYACGSGETTQTPSFYSWRNLTWTNIAGVDVWARWGIDQGGEAPAASGCTSCDPEDSTGFGYSLGVHGVAGDLEVWADVDFGVGSFVYYLARWNYSLEDVADVWLSCPLAISIEGVCDTSFREFDLVAEYPFGCANVITQLQIGCEGFSAIGFEIHDVEIGPAWFFIDSFMLMYQTDRKLWSLDLDLQIPEMLCIQPHFGWNLGGPHFGWNLGGPATTGGHTDTVIDSIELAGLSMEYSWDGITFLFAERFRKDSADSSDYFAITSDARLQSKTELFDTDPCRRALIMRTAGDEIDEAFGIEVDSDSCCGGGLDGGLYVFFDHELKDVSLFDWHHLVAKLDVGIAPGLEVGFEVVFDYDMASPNQLAFRFLYQWESLRLFDFDFAWLGAWGLIP